MPGWSTISRRRAQLPSNWRTLRRAVLERDGWRCTWLTAGRRCRNVATEVDHLVPSDHRMHMLRSLCPGHHKLVTQRQSAEAQGRTIMGRHPADPHPGTKDVNDDD